MSWNKNIFSYILWLMYAIIVGAGVIKISESIAEVGGYSKEYGFLLSGALFLGVGLIAFCVRKLAIKRQEAEAPKVAVLTQNTAFIMEGIACGVLFLIGIVLRVWQIPDVTGTASDMGYFEAAKVAEGNVVPQIAHAATYTYLKLLHLIFILLGNKLLVALWFQIILQCVMNVFLYLAIRKLVGRIPALVMTGFLSVSPYMLEQAKTLSPEILFLTIAAFILWLISGMWKNCNCNCGTYALVALTVGISIYLDISGLILLVFLLGIVSMKHEEPGNIWNKQEIVVLISILSVVLGWLGAILLKTLIDGGEVYNVLKNWMQLYHPDDFKVTTDLYVMSEENNSYSILINAIVLYAFLVFGVFSFWMHKEVEHQGIWIGVIIALWGLQAFQVVTIQLPGGIFLYVGLSVLAGIGISDVYAVNPPWGFDDEADENIIIENIITRKGEVIMQNGKDEQKVKYLENPLPVPKKNQVKIMEEHKDDDDDFDFKITDDDDFDC